MFLNVILKNINYIYNQFFFNFFTRKIMKNEYRKLVKANNLKPLKDLSELNDKKEVFGVGWDGQFQKGIITDDNRHVKFENEMGGTKVLEQGWINEGELTKQYKTVYSGLYIE